MKGVSNPPPNWRDGELKLGTKVRVAAWLASEVGEGNTFTREQLRVAFPGATQVERRMRDLREHGWEIDIARMADGVHMRLVKIGEPVWSPEGRLVAKRQIGTSAVRRSEILRRDNYVCTSCGVSAGEPHLDAQNSLARLSVRHLVSLAEGGTDGPENLVTICDRCNLGGASIPSVNREEVARQIQDLSMQHKTVLLAWMARGERTPSPLDRAWAMFRHLDPGGRKEVVRVLAEAVERMAGEDGAT
ncbi:HNH endonuclease [Streptomyces sp. NPDC005775]|uniref:HNH endonuclease n=1 Tax=unclassified Streptomyces TaxID=2593676 RepID=UPI00340814F2